VLVRGQSVVCFVTVSDQFIKYFGVGHALQGHLSRISQNSARYAIFAITPFLRGSK
jgi:hypothetical protein